MNPIETKKIFPKLKTTIIASLIILDEKVKTKNMLIISDNFVKKYHQHDDIFNIPFNLKETEKTVYIINNYPIVVTERKENDYGISINLHSKLELYDFYILESIAGSNKKNFYPVRCLINNIYQTGNSIISCLIGAIDKVMFLSAVDFNRTYSINDLKSEKKYVSIKDRINYFDQNIKFFIKNDRVYAGIAYLKDNILLLRYGFGSNVKHDFSFMNHEIPEFIDVKVDYSPYIIWCIDNAYGIDDENLLVGKIIEHLFMLLTKTGYSEPIIELYKYLCESNLLNLNADTLASIVQSLLKYGEKQLIETAVLELKKIEPKHIIIEISNRHLRRMQVLNQISETFNISISDIQKLNGIEFEMFLENQFIKYGFKVERTKGSGDFGADLIIETASGTRASIQAKRYKQKANLKAVQEVVASLAHYQTDFGIVITTSGFFQSAVDLAETNNVELWDEDKLIQFLSGDFDFSMLSKS